MTKEMDFRPTGVCSQNIHIELDDEGVVKDIRFLGGCSGNTQGVSALAIGHPAAGRHPLRLQGHLLPRSAGSCAGADAGGVAGSRFVKVREEMLSEQAGPYCSRKCGSGGRSSLLCFSGGNYADCDKTYGA